MVAIHFEGNRELAEPLKNFIATAEPAAKGRIRCIFGRGRNQAIDDFQLAASKDPYAARLLLLDSEGPVEKVHVDSIPRESIAWMVQLMEAWFLADRNALTAYFGADFREQALPANPQIEQVPKADVLRGLKEASRNTRKGPYAKGADTHRILGLLDPGRVRQAAPNCDRFLKRVAELTRS